MTDIPARIMEEARKYANETSPPGEQSIEQHEHRKLTFARAILAAEHRARKEALDDLLKDFEALNGARYLLQWMDMGTRPTEKTLRAHCERLQIDPPEECRDVDHVPPKALRTLWIVREVVRAHRAALANEKEG